MIDLDNQRIIRSVDGGRTRKKQRYKYKKRPLTEVKGPLGVE